MFMELCFFSDVAWAKVVSFDQSINVYQNKKSLNELPRQTLNPKGQCSTELWKLNRRLQQIVHPLELEGHWISTRYNFAWIWKMLMAV